MISRALADEELPVYGDGANVRDWLHVSDHCEAIDLILHKGRVGEIYNIGGHNERTNVEVVKTILEALNTDLVCDAINTAMRELFLQIVYGRSQTAFSENGLPVGAGLEDLGKGLRSQVGTMYGTKAKGVRYLEMAEGYCLEMGLDENGEVIGYKFVHLGKMMEAIRKGMDPKEAYEKNINTYGRYEEAVKYVDPRKE